MKKDNKKALYESIMTSVAKQVKKALNESWEDYAESNNWKEANQITRRLRTIFNEEFNKFGYKMFDLNNWGRVLATAYIGSTSQDRTDEGLGNWGDIQPLYNKLQPILGIKNMWLEYPYEDWMWFIWDALRSILIKDKHISSKQADIRLEKLLNKSRAEIGTISSNKYLTYKQAVKDAIKDGLISSENDVHDAAYEILADYMGIDENTLMDNDIYYICVNKLKDTYNKLRYR